jgi:hypothetical protein
VSFGLRRITWHNPVAGRRIGKLADIAKLRADAQAELERLGPERIAEFDPVFFKPVVVNH